MKNFESGSSLEKMIPRIMESLSVNCDWKKREYDEYMFIGCISTHYLSSAVASM